MSEWRRTPLATHQRRGAGGGVRACGARARERGAGDSGAERGEGSRESTGQRDSIADGTALRCGRVGSRHFRELEEKSPGSLVFYVYVTRGHPKVPSFTLATLSLGELRHTRLFQSLTVLN